MNLKFSVLFLSLVALLHPTTSVAQSRAILGDFDGDQISDLFVTRNTESNKHWFIRLSNNSYPQPIVFGETDDIAITADFDGDGIVNPTVIRVNSSGDQEWLSLDRENKINSSIWGSENDDLKIGFFDSDTKMDKVAIRLESSRQLKWFIKRSSDSLVEIFNWGINGDVPYIGNFDNDTTNDACVVREAGGKLIWYVRSTMNGGRDGIVFGITGDQAIQPADMDGDGIDDFIVIRSASEYSTVYVRYNNQNGTASKIDSFSFGLAGDHFSVGNYNSAEIKTVLATRTAYDKLIASNFIFKPAASPLRLDFGLKGDAFLTPNGGSIEIGAEYNYQLRNSSRINSN